MKKKEYFMRSFLNATGVLAYISLVAGFLFNGKQLFGKEETFLLPILMLLLFVTSAAITGSLVLGKPIHLYLSGLKKEAFTMLFATIGWLVLFLVVIIGILLVQ
ncbi:MAG: hypothetical protein WCV80_01195 [Candidatus Paceibacterota bacterium]|jgi:hypothetical protein